MGGDDDVEKSKGYGAFLFVDCFSSKFYLPTFKIQIDISIPPKKDEQMARACSTIGEVNGSAQRIATQKSTAHFKPTLSKRYASDAKMIMRHMLLTCKIHYKSSALVLRRINVERLRKLAKLNKVFRSFQIIFTLHQSTQLRRPKEIQV